MRRRIPKYWLRSFSALAVNLSAGWFALTIIGTNISFPQNPDEYFSLTANLVFGIVYLLISVLLEKEIER